MAKTMVHPYYGRQTFVFSPICELTNRFNDTLRIQEQVSLFTLISEGWKVV